MLPSTRVYFFLLCLTLVLASFYFQYVLNLTPCPLCMMQRVMLCVMTVLAAFSFFFSKKIYWRLHQGMLLCSALGLYFAGRQLYIMYIAGHDLACAPGLEMVLKYFPLKDIAYLLFWGSGDCAKITWRLLSMPMAFWSFLSFLFMTLLLLLSRFHTNE